MDMWTDGSSWAKGAEAGGWAVYVPAEDIVLSGHEEVTTNNRMELTAIIKAMSLLYDSQRECEFSKVFSDSQWAINVTTGKWRAVKNLDLVQEAKALYANLPNFNLVWIKGHSNNANNDMADKLAKKAALGEEPI